MPAGSDEGPTGGLIGGPTGRTSHLEPVTVDGVVDHLREVADDWSAGPRWCPVVRLPAGDGGLGNACSALLGAEQVLADDTARRIVQLADDLRRVRRDAAVADRLVR